MKKKMSRIIVKNVKVLSDREIIGKCLICGGKSTGDQCDECGASLSASEVLGKHCKKVWFFFSNEK